MPIQQNVTEVVRWCMAARRENQRQLAAALGLAVPTISLKMNGRRPWTLEEVEALAQHYGLEPRVFLTDPASLVGPELVTAGAGAGGESVTPQERPGRARGGSVLTLPLQRTAFQQVAA